VNTLRAVAVAVLLLPLAAVAQTPTWGTFELRLDSYRPDVDSEFAGGTPVETPYADVFGTKRGWFPKVLASYTLFDRFVQVDVGLGTGWFRAKAKGLYAVAFDGSLVSRDSTTFSIIPATLAVTVRLDGFAERWPIPVGLYGRAALERYHWLVTDGSGSVTQKGATNGWSVAGGVSLLLDFFDPTLARELDYESGVNHTWLYFEVEKSVIDDFGSTKSWILSDERLTLGGGLRMVF